MIEVTEKDIIESERTLPDGSEELPKLKPCPFCGGRLEYWNMFFVGCTTKNCFFTLELK